ncbi:hypothetical protein Thermo_01296 [Thermoplasmatales archaeon]|nr:hypothetical protein Thermo_01296 [Thermoplasmatales archaeon]
MIFTPNMSGSQLATAETSGNGTSQSSFFGDYYLNGSNINGTLNFTKEPSQVIITVNVEIKFARRDGFFPDNRTINETADFTISKSGYIWNNSAVTLPFIYNSHVISHYNSVYINVTNKGQVQQVLDTSSGLGKYHEVYMVYPTFTGYVNYNDLYLANVSASSTEPYKDYSFPPIYEFGFGSKLLYNFEGTDPVLSYILNLSVKGSTGYFHPPFSLTLTKTNFSIGQINWLYVIGVYLVVGIIVGLPIILIATVILLGLFFYRRKKRQKTEGSK